MSIRTYPIFRHAFGIYLFSYFFNACLFQFDFFSVTGVWGAQNPVTGLFYSPFFLEILFNPASLILIFCMGMVCSLTLSFGYLRKISSLMLLVLIQLLLLRNPYTRTVTDGFTGWMLLLLLTIPEAESCNFFKWRDDLKALPKSYWWAMVIVVGAIYAASAYSKFMAYEWRTGEALGRIFDLPLVRSWTLVIPTSPIMLKFLTYFVIAVEAVYLPLMIFKPLRKPLQFAMIALHLGILVTFDFERIPLLMMLLHFLLIQEPEAEKNSL